MSAYSTLTRRILVALMLSLLIAAPAALAGDESKGEGESKNGDKQKMQDTEMPSDTAMGSDTAAGDTEKGGKKEKVIKADKMDKKKLRAELEAASDDTVIEYKGKKTTKKQLKIDAEKRAKDEQATMATVAPSAGGDPTAVISQFNQQEQAKLEAANAKVRSEMARLISLNPAAKDAAIQTNPASGAPVQRSINAPVRAPVNSPVEQTVR